MGAGAGGLVYVLRSRGCDASGIEPNGGYAKFAADVLGLPVSKGFYQNVVVETGSQDVVTMFHVLEHLEKPQEVMQLVRGWLRDKGQLLIEVPNVEAVCQQPHTQFHIGHLFHFNLAALERMGQRAGYNVFSRSQSPDGGNIVVVFQKGDCDAVPGAEIPGNFERVTAILRRHTRLRHFFSRYPYVRPLTKLARQLGEQWGVRRGDSPRQILDDLISSKLK